MKKQTGSLFSSGWDNKKMIYHIPGVSSDIMKAVIEYTYTRRPSITINNVEQLLIAADQFDVTGLKKACCKFLVSQLCFKNCIDICKFADHYNCPELKQQAQLFTLHNFEEMVKVSEEFLQLSVDEIAELIEKDDLTVKKENAVFDSILKWTAHDSDNRKKFMPLLLTKVRLALMDANYFMCIVKNNDYVKDNEQCKPVVINALKVMNRPSHQNCRHPLTRPRFPDAVLFAFGGWRDGIATNTINTYDHRTTKWMNFTCEEESPQAFHGTVYLKGYMYIIGGCDNLYFLNTVRCFDPVKKTWRQVCSMHSKRCHVSVTVLNNLIYALGGTDERNYLNTAERYDPKTDQWTLISPMHDQRGEASATALHGKVYICGGSNESGCLSSAEIYSPETNQWTFITPMKCRRKALGVIAYAQCVYAVGGFDGICDVRSAEYYSPLTSRWHSISSMFWRRTNFGIEVLDDLLFTVGGRVEARNIEFVEYYDKKVDRWYKTSGLSRGHSGVSCCVIPGLPNVRDYVVPRDSYDYL